MVMLNFKGCKSLGPLETSVFPRNKSKNLDFKREMRSPRSAKKITVSTTSANAGGSCLDLVK